MTDEVVAREAAEVADFSVWDLKTMTGLTLAEVYVLIDSDLGKGAYKEFTGSGGFKGTDIKPPYVYDTLTKAFGPMGIGWGYDLVSTSYIGERTYKTQSNKDRTEYGFSARVAPWYCLDDATGRVYIGEMVGGSANAERHYAEQGAITNALGKAWSFFGVQRHVYKNEEPDTSNPDEVGGAKFAGDGPMTSGTYRLIQNAAKRLGYDSENMTATMRDTTGKESSVDLTEADAQKVLAALNANLQEG